MNKPLTWASLSSGKKAFLVLLLAYTIFRFGYSVAHYNPIVYKLASWDFYDTYERVGRWRTTGDYSVTGWEAGYVYYPAFYYVLFYPFSSLPFPVVSFFFYFLQFPLFFAAILLMARTVFYLRAPSAVEVLIATALCANFLPLLETFSEYKVEGIEFFLICLLVYLWRKKKDGWTGALVVLAAVFLSGCAVLPLESPTVPRFSSRAASAVQSTYHEAIGVIHVHSTASDGHLPPEAIARIADREGLDFLILTDHNTLKAKTEGKEGRYGGTLMLVGDEISTADGHYLALRIQKEISSREASQWTADQVVAQGGLGFIPHPFWKRKPWSNPVLRGFVGIEIYNAAEDALNKNPVILGTATLLEGSDLSVGHWVARLDKSLAFWDRTLAEGRQVVGIGGADAHGLVRFGLRLAPYSTIFKLVRDHLLIQGEVTEAAVYEALEKGHLFVAHDVVADARGFLFAVVEPNGAVRGIMGDRVKREPGQKLYAHLPSPGEIRFLKDGKEVARAAGQEGWLPVDGPGVYRVEATRRAKPWIYSNPVYVIE